MPTVRTTASLVSRFRNKIREVGIFYFLYLVLRRLSSPRLFQQRRFFVTALELGPAAASHRNRPDIREATYDDFPQFIEFGESEEDLIDRFRKGQRVWVIERSGRFLACDWLAGSMVDFSDWLILERSEGDVWSNFLRVDRQHRGSGFGPLLRRHVVQECAEQGYKRMLGIIDTLNHNSIRAFGRVGYQAIGCVFFVRILGFTAIHYKSMWRFGFWSSTRPLRVPVRAVEDASCLSHWNAKVESQSAVL